MGKYDLTLFEVPGEIVGINQVGVTMGLINKHTEPGFVLADGSAVLESEKDEAGFYIGGTGMDGMFLSTPERYEPVRDEDGAVYAFRRMSEHLTRFTGEEQQTIFQYAMNTPEHLIEDLTAALPALERDPQTHTLFCETVRKLNQVPSGNCVRLMADLHAAYKSRAEQSVRERQKAARKSAKRERDMER